LINEDKEFQIKLAELQADVQILVTACFGFLGIIGGFMLIFYQLFFTTPAIQPEIKYSFMILIIVTGIMFFAVARFYVEQIRKKRKEISDLRKQFIW
jgi:TRAP-type C4-dicarboxylate transport system permease small subunit